MKVLKSPISMENLQKIAKSRFGNLVKAVVDIEKKIIVIDADLHADQEALLLKHGSKQKNLWGVNLYPKIKGEDWIEFDSMINLRPSQNNLTCSVDDPITKKRIAEIVEKLINR